MIAVVIVVTIASALLIPGLRVSTSRTGLVSDDDPQQRRMNAFFSEFGRPDEPLFVISGGEVAARRQVVDRLEAALEAESVFTGRVMGRIRPEDAAEVLLLQRPEAFVQLRAALPGDVEVPTLLEGGLPAWLELLERQVVGGLEGQSSDPGPDGAAAGLDQLALLAGLLDDAIAGQDPLARAGAQAGGNGLERPGIDRDGYLVTEQGDNLVIVYAKLDTDEGMELTPIITQLRSIRDRVLADGPPDVTAELTGLPSLAVDELVVVSAGLGSSSIATTIGIFLLCLALFRSVRQTIVALLPLLPGVLVTLAVVRLLYGALNLVTSSFVAVLLGLGIDFSVHLISRRNEEVRSGKDEPTALTIASRLTGPGIVTGAVITAAAFLTNATTEFTAYAELGIITAVGLLASMVATLFLIPPLLAIGRGKTVARAAPEPPGLDRVPGFVRKLRIPITVIAFAAAIAGAVALPRIGFEPRYFSFLPTSTESARALIRLEYDPVVSPVFAALTADDVEEARAMTDALRGFESVAGVQSPSDLLPPLDLAALQRSFAGIDRDPDFARLAALELSPAVLLTRVKAIADALDEVRFAVQGTGGPVESAERAARAFKELAGRVEHATPEEAARIGALHRQAADLLAPAWRTARAVAARGSYAPSDLPPRFAARFVSRDGKRLALYAVPKGQFWEPVVANRFSADVRTVDPDAAGLAMIHVAHGEMILAGFKRAAAIAAGVILLLLLLDFRRIDHALFALLPTALGWLWMLGAQVLFGIRFNVANIVALPLVIGIGIAFGVHMMHRLREGSGELDDLIRGTGGAIGVAAATTMVGFAGLMLADYGAMVSLGIVMVIGIGACFGATVLVLPAVLLLLGRVR